MYRWEGEGEECVCCVLTEKEKEKENKSESDRPKREKGEWIDSSTIFTHDSKRASRENFEREALEKTRLTHPQSLPKRLFKFLYSFPLHC